MFKTILVPLDGSALAEAALPQARRLAQAAGATLILVRIVHDTVHSGLALRAVTGHAEMYLSSIAATLADQNIQSHNHVSVGDAAQGILQSAAVYSPDVIVMNTHGLSGLRHVLLGSVAEHVLHATDLPVLLVRGSHQMPMGPYNKILIPLDGTPGAERALRLVAQEQFAHESEIFLLHCEIPLSVSSAELGYPYLMGAGSYIPQDIIDKADQETREHCTAARTYLEGLARQYLTGHCWRTHVALGDPALTAVHLATEHQIDLIVMTTHARVGLERLIEGSVAAHVLGHAPAPVLLMHRQEEARILPDTAAHGAEIFQ